MTKLSLWKPHKSKDYNFLDKISREQFYVGSVSIYIHKYLGVLDQGNKKDPTQPGKNQSKSWSVLTIQDLTFGENRNREYADDVIELRGYYQQADNDFELLQHGLAIATGTKFFAFHLNDMLDKFGRKLMAGDVLELPNLRDDALLGDERAVNQWFVIEDGNWPTEGFGPTWYPHLWRVKANPMKDAPEYYDITRNSEGNLDPLIDLLSMHQTYTDTNQAVVDKATQTVPTRNFETRHVYVVPGDEENQYPWIFAGDGIPPNNSEKAEAGSSFIDNPTEGTYFLRTDYEPNRLFKFEDGAWRYTELDFAKTWNKAHRLLEKQINNEEEFQEKSKIIKERQPISKAVKPKADF